MGTVTDVSMDVDRSLTGWYRIDAQVRRVLDLRQGLRPDSIDGFVFI
jgi:hypothetical protein